MLGAVSRQGPSRSAHPVPSPGVDEHSESSEESEEEKPPEEDKEEEEEKKAPTPQEKRRRKGGLPLSASRRPWCPAPTPPPEPPALVEVMGGVLLCS